MTVFAYDAARTGPVRMGGDDLHVGTYVTAPMNVDGDHARAHRRQELRHRRLHGRQAGRHPRHRRRLDGSPSSRPRRLTLTGGPALTPRTGVLTTVTIVPTGVLGGPSSPLVLYGDTSQDGLWYSGNPATIDGYEFGDKPFNPFIFVPDSQNEDDEWVFPLGNPFRCSRQRRDRRERALRQHRLQRDLQQPAVGRDHGLRRRRQRHDLSAARPATTSRAARATT